MMKGELVTMGLIGYSGSIDCVFQVHALMELSSISISTSVPFSMRSS